MPENWFIIRASKQAAIVKNAGTTMVINFAVLLYIIFWF